MTCHDFSILQPFLKKHNPYLRITHEIARFKTHTHGAARRPPLPGRRAGPDSCEWNTPRGKAVHRNGVLSVSVQNRGKIKSHNFFLMLLFAMDIMSVLVFCPYRVLLYASTISPTMRTRSMSPVEDSSSDMPRIK